VDRAGRRDRVAGEDQRQPEDRVADHEPFDQLVPGELRGKPGGQADRTLDEDKAQR
jgi:hypothetical protein